MIKKSERVSGYVFWGQGITFHPLYKNFDRGRWTQKR